MLENIVGNIIIALFCSPWFVVTGVFIKVLLFGETVGV